MTAFLVSYLGSVAGFITFGVFVVIYDAIINKQEKKEGEKNGKRENRED